MNEFFYKEKEERKVQGLVTLGFERMLCHFLGKFFRLFELNDLKLEKNSRILVPKASKHSLNQTSHCSKKLSFYLPFHAVISNGFWLIAESGVSDPHQYEMKFFSVRETYSFFSGFYINLLSAWLCRAIELLLCLFYID